LAQRRREPHHHPTAGTGGRLPGGHARAAHRPGIRLPAGAATGLPRSRRSDLVAAPPRLTRVRTRWLINLLLLGVVAALAVYALYAPRTDEAQREPITQLAPSVVRNIAIEAVGAD